MTSEPFTPILVVGVRTTLTSWVTLYNKSSDKRKKDSDLLLKIYSCILILGGDKGTDAHTDSTQTNSRPRFHQHQINSVWSPLHEHRTLISTSKPEWESSGGWNSQGELKGSHRLYWAFYLIFNVYPPFHIMASFLSDTSLSFPLWNFFYVYFSIFFLLSFFVFLVSTYLRRLFMLLTLHL